MQKKAVIGGTAAAAVVIGLGAWWAVDQSVEAQTTERGTCGSATWKLVGDPVTLEEAVTKTRASACWEGVRRRSVTVPLVVEEVEVDGVHERVAGSIAFVPTTQSWLRPMREVWDGVLGSQDVNICH